MTGFVAGTDRGQSALLPECLDDWVDESNPIREIDAYVALDLRKLGFEGVDPAETRRHFKLASREKVRVSLSQWRHPKASPAMKRPAGRGVSKGPRYRSRGGRSRHPMVDAQIVKRFTYIPKNSGILCGALRAIELPRETFRKLPVMFRARLAAARTWLSHARDRDFLSSQGLPGNHWTHSGPSCSALRRPFCLYGH
jgi:hypothetical protein